MQRLQGGSCNRTPSCMPPSWTHLHLMLPGSLDVLCVLQGAHTPLLCAF